MEALKRCGIRMCEVIKGDIMNALMVTGIVVGFITGIVLFRIRETPYSSREIMYISFPGELFLRMLKSVAVVLMTACLVTAIGSLDIRLSKRIGSQFMVFVLLTKLLSAFLGIIVGLTLRPGDYGKSSDVVGGDDLGLTIRVTTPADTFMDIARNMFPSNVLSMFYSSYQTQLIDPGDGSINYSTWEIKEGGKMTSVTNMLGIVVCSVVLGIALSVMATESKPVLDLFRCLTQTFMTLTVCVLWIAPVLIIFLLAGQVLLSEGFLVLLSKVGMYIVSMIVGFSLEAFIVMPVLYFVLVWKNPYHVMKSVVGSLVTGFATQSSLGTMPMAMKDLEKAGYDKRIVQFVIPVGVNLNKDGVAIYVGIGTVFFSQMYDRALSFSNIMTILLMGSAVSMATAGVPYAAPIMLIMMLEGVDLPYKDVGLIIAVDWFVDRLSTVVSIYGNCILTAILADFNKHLLSDAPEEQE